MYAWLSMVNNHAGLHCDGAPNCRFAPCDAKRDYEHRFLWLLPQLKLYLTCTWALWATPNPALCTRMQRGNSAVTPNRNVTLSLWLIQTTRIALQDTKRPKQHLNCQMMTVKNPPCAKWCKAAKLTPSQIPHWQLSNPINSSPILTHNKLLSNQIVKQ